SGTDTLTYTVVDAVGTSATATVTITVEATNDAPLAVGDVADTVEERPVFIDVTDNDSDVDGDSLLVLAVEGAAHGHATVAGRGVRYVPAADFSGEDTFTYAVTDGEG